jgi:hypothetical protein
MSRPRNSVRALAGKWSLCPRTILRNLYVNIAPHPGRKARKGFFGRRFVRVVVRVAVDACGVGPIRLDSDDIKPMFFNQVARDRARVL